MSDDDIRPAVGREPLIREDDLSGEAVRGLLALHLAGLREASPPGTVIALDLSGLRAPGVTVWCAWRGDAIAGVGALRALGGGTGEVKSMRTHPDHLRTGVAAALLDRILTEARARGLRRLRLETGGGPAFAAAHALYRSRGFAPGGTFGECGDNGFSRFFHLDL